MENKKNKRRQDPTLFTAKCALAATSEGAYVDLLFGKGSLYELCHRLVSGATNEYGVLSVEEKLIFHASFRVKPVLREREPSFMS